MTLPLTSPRRIFLTGAVAAGVLAAGLASPLSTARADDATAAVEPGVITVSAEGVTAIAPDMAVISLTVLREAETAREALDANNAAMNEVLNAMKEEGIAERDLQTGGFSIQPRWVYPDSNTTPREAPSIVGYQVQNTLTVRVRDLDRLGAILDTSVSLGVNQGGNIVFTNDDQEAIRDQARVDAIARARAKAEQMTGALGVGLGRITQISENQRSGEPVPMMRAEMVAMAPKGADAVPVASGESEYRVTVSVTWEIDQ